MFSRRIYMVPLFIAMIDTLCTSEQNGSVEVSCVSDILSGPIFREASLLKCGLNRDLNNNEIVVWMFPNCTTIGTCKDSRCLPPTYRKGSEYLTLSTADDQFTLYILKPGISKYFIFAVNDSFHGLIHTQIVSTNGAGNYPCASNHFELCPCLLANTIDLESDCEDDHVTDTTHTITTTQFKDIELSTHLRETHVSSTVNLIPTCNNNPRVPQTNEVQMFVTICISLALVVLLASRLFKISSQRI